MQTMILAAITAMLSAYTYHLTSIIQPEFSEKWRATYSPAVVLVNTVESSDMQLKGGSAFFVRDTTGRVRLITANHVCDYTGMSINGKTVYPIHRAPDKDLCELSNPFGKVEFLELAAPMNRLGLRVALLGFPRTRGITMVTGEIYAKNQSIICEDDDDTNYKCPKILSDLTNISIVGGMSGGPAVNWMGEVVGVIIAHDRQNWWAQITAQENLDKFLRGVK